MRHLIYSIRSAILVCVSMSIVLFSGVSHAADCRVLFPFDDSDFVDVLAAKSGTLTAFPGPSTNTKITKFITDKNLASAVGMNSIGASMKLEFTDNVAENGAGPDIVVFEWFDATEFDVTINNITKSVIGGAICDGDGHNNNAVTIDLTDFGIPQGGQVSELTLSRSAGGQLPAPSAVAALNTEACGIEVVVDINPGDFPNEIDLFNNNIVPVIILGSDTFDVTDVDWTTLAFGPAGAALEHGADPEEFEDHQQDDNGDGFDDLHMHYFTQETGIAFGDTQACVTGETLDDVPMAGCDSITTLTGNTGCGIGFELAFLLPPLMWLHGQRRRRIH